MSLALVEGGGVLTIRDAEEPALIEQPTTLIGTADDSTGAIAGTFATPVMEIELPVPDLNTTAYVDATFSETAPGVTTGSAVMVEDSLTQASVTLDTTLKVDLHIEVGSPAIVTADCTASPIVLDFKSVGVYDSETGKVTLADNNFSVPAVPITETCPDYIQSRVNAQLQGTGHAISLAFEGELPLPTQGPNETITALTVDPPTAARLGDSVTLTANVVPDEGQEPGVPGGQVEFRDGTGILGAAPLDETGTAVLTTDELPAGNYQMEARYVGDATYRQSFSTKVPLLVAADPVVDVTMADTVLFGGNPRAITVDIANPELGLAIDNARLDVTIRRDETTSFLNVDAIKLEWLNGDTWVRLPLVYNFVARTASAQVGAVGGEALPASSALQHKLRISMPDPIDLPLPTQCTDLTAPCLGDWELTFGLKEVAPGDGTIVDDMTEAVHPFILTEKTRREPTLTILGGAPRPHTARQNTNVDVAVSVGPSIGGAGPSGFFELYIDGQLTPARTANMPYEQGYINQVAMGTGLVLIQFPVGDLDVGPHFVTARYLGDALFAPKDVTTSFTVLPASGHPFVCQTPNSNSNNWYGVGMTFDTDIPATAVAGSPVDLDVSAAGWSMARPGLVNPFPSLANNATRTVGEGSLLDGVTFDLGPDGSTGTGSAQSVTRTFGNSLSSNPNPADESQVDQKITFGGPFETSITIDGEPGDIVPITLDQVVMAMHLSGGLPVPTVSTCIPKDEPMPLGEVEIAGTKVSVDPDPAREGTDVVDLEAETYPAAAAGTVSFSSSIDGVLGSDAVSGGSASLSTDELSPGTHTITASFNAADPEVPDTQGTVTVVVQYSPRTTTQAFVVAARTDYTGSAGEDDVLADTGAISAGQSKTAYLGELSRSDEYLAHVVNEMYLDTLGREGDAAGVEFWIGRLRAGWSVARVAASFYSSEEYYQRVGGTDEAWIGDLYEVLLGRQADAPGLAFWIAEIPRRGRGGVALAFFQTPESARSRVAVLYGQFLGRASNQADRDFWANRVIARGDLILAVELTLSDEYANRAQTRFPLV